MEEQANSEVKQKKKSNDVIPLWKGIIISIGIFFAIYLTVLGISTLKNKYIDNSYKVSYVGIENEDDYIFVNFKIESENKFTINASDFTVYINQAPTISNGIFTGIHKVTYNNIISSSKEVDNETIKVKFSYTQDELDSPIRFFYKGKELKFGETLKFKID